MTDPHVDVSHKDARDAVPRRRHPISRWSLLGLQSVLLIGWLVAVNIGPPFSDQAARAQMPATASSEAGRAIGRAEDLSSAFREAASQALPAVVLVKTISNARPHVDDDFLPLTFPEDDGFFVEDVPWSDPEALLSDVSSGVLVHPGGIVLTNNHVIEGAESVVVHLADGRSFDVVDIQSEPAHDLAVLRLACSGTLPAAKLGESRRLEIGDWVLAIGSPYELEQTVSAGIISAKGRLIEGAGQAQYLQTDAAINPGSSGGALVNLNGELVGITSGIASGTGGYQGIGFAVPVELATPLVERISRTRMGRSTRNDERRRPDDGSAARRLGRRTLP